MSAARFGAATGGSLDASAGPWYRSHVQDETPYQPISEREIATGRALAVVAYLPALSLIGLLEAPRNRYVQFHARQGLILFLIEITVWIALALFDATFGRVPIAGFLVSATLRLATGLTFLAVTVYGALKAVGGELVRVPFLGEAADRISVGCR